MTARGIGRIGEAGNVEVAEVKNGFERAAVAAAARIARANFGGGERRVDLAFAAGPGIRQLISGELAPRRAIETGVIEVLRGRGALLERFASTFHLAA